jgi:endonuclease/exonuclease/phosphatase family metal-dependent hydrolase
MEYKVVAWNMQHQKGESNWDRLMDPKEPVAGADLYLLCEAVPVPDRIRDAGLGVEMNGSTKEKDCPCGEGKCDKRLFSTAVASPNRVEPLPFAPDPRAGTWTACRVDLGGIPVTAIALYGLNDSAYAHYYESADAAVEEIVTILEHEQYGKHVLLGGDFNILAGAKPYPGHDVLKKIESHGLIECLEARLPKDRYRDELRRKDMDNCQCEMGPKCTHTRTFYKSDDPDTPHQDDYLFASASMERLLADCRALPVVKTSASDHAPIIATFEI